ncbi:hypothetical protein SAMN05444392_10360 [Seinonella peptonophila]|uniref:Uncharacterized protein n=1 Tax=Seinonella peptonophila TaxID=112248 RepID=A0A1M4W6C3_9BACL|nr:hypothetical protein [Seinonella peptonophila]SHE76808.1 hypothetical protein SAMN05444392_10360 [Seinonella peptonophila]
MDEDKKPPKRKKRHSSKKRAQLEIENRIREAGNKLGVDWSQSNSKGMSIRSIARRAIETGTEIDVDAIVSKAKNLEDRKK